MSCRRRCHYHEFLIWLTDADGRESSFTVGVGADLDTEQARRFLVGYYQTIGCTVRKLRGLSSNPVRLTGQRRPAEYRP